MSDDNEGVLCIPQSSSITGTSTTNCLVSYPGYSLGESYLSAEKQSVYFTDPANWAKLTVVRNGIKNFVDCLIESMRNPIFSNCHTRPLPLLELMCGLYDFYLN